MAERVTYTVATTAGSRQHVVDGLSENLATVRQISDAFAGTRPGFFLANPPTFYALANVISVSVDGGPAAVIKEAERSMGTKAKHNTK